MACPVDGFHSFTDTWGRPPLGRQEAMRGWTCWPTGARRSWAVEDGRIDRMANGGRGGITVWMDGDSGDRYYYAHLDSLGARSGGRPEGVPR